MIVNVGLLALGLVLLWFPRPWMRRAVALLKRRRRSRGSEPIGDPWKGREPGDPRVYPRVEFAKVRNYLDLLRAGAGGVLIWGEFGVLPVIAAEPGAPRAMAHRVLAVQCAIALIAVLVQAIRRDRHRLSFYPPIFFLAGLSVGMCGYRAAAFAFVFIWAINSALPNARTFLTFYAAATLVFGFLFEGAAGLLPVIATGVLVFLPTLLSLLADRPLLIFSRRGG